MRVPLDGLRLAAGGSGRDRQSGPNSPRPLASSPMPSRGPSSELVLIGATVDEALERAEKFLDTALLTDERRLRIVHGHGTGRLREALRAYFREHALVASVAPAPENEGGQGATIVELKD